MLYPGIVKNMKAKGRKNFHIPFVLILPDNQYDQVDSLPEYLKVVEDGNSQATYDQPETSKSKEALEDQDGPTEDYDDVMPPPGYDSEDYDDVG